MSRRPSFLTVALTEVLIGYITSAMGFLVVAFIFKTLGWWCNTPLGDIGAMAAGMLIGGPVGCVLGIDSFRRMSRPDSGKNVLGLIAGFVLFVGAAVVLADTVLFVSWPDIRGAAFIAWLVPIALAVAGYNLGFVLRRRKTG